MEQFDILEELKNESKHKFSNGKIKEYGIARLCGNETNIHVFVPVDNITWREFPPKNLNIPKLKFEEEVKKERNFDFLSTNISADGFFITEKAKKVLENFNLGNHRFYPAKLVVEKRSFFKKDITANYYWLHLVFDETKDDFIDFKESVFREKVTYDGDIVGINKLKFNDLNEWEVNHKTKHDRWLNNSENEKFHELIPWLIKLNKTKELPEIINFGRVGDSEMLFSKKLAKAIVENNLKGIEISATNIII